MSKSTLKILPALLAAITAACVTNTVFAGSITDHQLVLTENSSSSLSVTFDGTAEAVTFHAANFWSFSMPGVSSNGTNSFSWLENVFGSNNHNLVLFAPDSGLFLVSSEAPISGAANGPNGFTFVDAFILTSDGVPIDMTFHDIGDPARTPDTGTTGSLLGLSLMGLAFFRRKLS